MNKNYIEKVTDILGDIANDTCHARNLTFSKSQKIFTFIMFLIFLSLSIFGVKYGTKIDSSVITAFSIGLMIPVIGVFFAVMF